MGSTNPKQNNDTNLEKDAKKVSNSVKNVTNTNPKNFTSKSKPLPTPKISKIIQKLSTDVPKLTTAVNNLNKSIEKKKKEDPAKKAELELMADSVGAGLTGLGDSIAGIIDASVHDQPADVGFQVLSMVGSVAQVIGAFTMASGTLTPQVAAGFIAVGEVVVGIASTLMQLLGAKKDDLLTQIVKSLKEQQGEIAINDLEAVQAAMSRAIADMEPAKEQSLSWENDVRAHFTTTIAIFKLDTVASWLSNERNSQTAVWPDVLSVYGVAAWMYLEAFLFGLTRIRLTDETGKQCDDLDRAVNVLDDWLDTQHKGLIDFAPYMAEFGRRYFIGENERVYMRRRSKDGAIDPYDSKAIDLCVSSDGLRIWTIGTNGELYTWHSDSDPAWIDINKSLTIPSNLVSIFTQPCKKTSIITTLFTYDQDGKLRRLVWDEEIGGNKNENKFTKSHWCQQWKTRSGVVALTAGPDATIYFLDNAGRSLSRYTDGSGVGFESIVNVPMELPGARDFLGLASDLDGLYIYTRRGIAFKPYKALDYGTPWEIQPVPDSRVLQLPQDWCFTDVSVCQDGVLTAIIASASNVPPKSPKMDHRKSMLGPAGEMYSLAEGQWNHHQDYNTARFVVRSPATGFQLYAGVREAIRKSQLIRKELTTA